MVKKILVLGVIMIMALGALGGCSEDNIAEHLVIVTVKTEFHDKFVSKDFSIDDFNWDNVDRFEYGAWSSINNTGELTVLLKKHGKKQVRQAVRHFNKLTFVEVAKPMEYNITHF